MNVLSTEIVASWKAWQQYTLMLLEALSEDQLISKPSGSKWSVADVFCHMHNVRIAWIENIRTLDQIPEKAPAGTIAKEELRKALESSGQCVAGALDWALVSGKKIPGFKGSALDFLVYLCSHEAHHRSQIIQMIKSSGTPISSTVKRQLWNA